MDVLHSLLVAEGAGNVTALVLCYLVWRQTSNETASRKRLEDKVERLEAERLAKLEQRVEDHIKDDRSQQILNELKNLGGNVEKTLNLTIAAREDNATQAADIKNLKNYLDNLRDDLREHARNCNQKD